MTIGTLRRVIRPWQWVGALRRNKTRNDEAYLLSSRTNAARLHAAIESASNGNGTRISIDDLRAQVAGR